MTIKVWAHEEGYRRSLSVVVLDERADGRTYRAKALEFVEFDQGSLILAGDETAGGVDRPQDEGREFLRAALNAAWELGLRPDGFNDTRESMKATKAHLEDMRQIAFHKIGADNPAKPQGEQTNG